MQAILHGGLLRKRKHSRYAGMINVRILTKRWLLRFVPIRSLPLMRVDGEKKNGRTVRRHARAECDSPASRRKEIRIKSGAVGQELVELVVHESLHAAAWHIDEELVQQFAHDVSRILAHPEIWGRIQKGINNGAAS